MIRRHLLKILALASFPAWQPFLLRQALAAGVKPVAPGLFKLSGAVRINGTPAVAGQTIRTGDHIETGPDGQAIYVIGGDAFLQRENTSVSFGGEEARDLLRLLTGKLLAVFAKGQRRIETLTATIGIRGTGCYLEAEPRRVYFCLCYGSADITPLADPGRAERIVTRHHDHPVYLHADSHMPMMAPATVINHTDAELILLENLVGRWPPFYGQVNNSY